MQAPSGQPQPAKAGERQPDYRQQNKLLGDATQLRGHAQPRPQSQDEREQQNTGNNKPANPGEAGMNFRETKHQAQGARDSQQKSSQSPPPRGRSSGDRFAKSSARRFDTGIHQDRIVSFGDV